MVFTPELLVFEQNKEFRWRGILPTLAWGALEPGTRKGLELMNIALKKLAESSP